VALARPLQGCGGATASATNKNFTGGSMSVKAFCRIWRLWVAVFVIHTSLHFFGVKIQFSRSCIMSEQTTNNYHQFVQMLNSELEGLKDKAEMLAGHYGYHYPHPMWSEVIPALQKCILTIKLEAYK
jgi:hypothetical protein